MSTQQHTEPPVLISQREAAHLLGVERTTIWRMVKRRDLTSVKIGSRCLIVLASLREYVDSQAECG
jgi:excisionase family DNA binding protein